jgi:hypothetical protein
LAISSGITSEPSPPISPFISENRGCDCSPASGNGRNRNSFCGVYSSTPPGRRSTSRKLPPTRIPHLRAVGGESYPHAPSRPALYHRCGVVFRLFRSPRPFWLLRWLMTDWSTKREVLVQVQAAISSVAPGVLARRLQEVLTADVSQTLRSCEVRTCSFSADQPRALPLSGNSACSLLALHPILTRIGE